MAITQSTPYNPEFHSHIPRNYRELWAEKTNRLLSLSDEEIFYIWRNHYSDDYEEEFKTYDDYVMSIFSESLDEREKNI
jgi:hypothetical protein